MSPVRTWSERRKEAASAPSGFKPLEPGQYDFVIKEPATLRTSSNGNTNWSFKAVVEKGPRQNATIFHDIYDSEKPSGISFMLDQFSALGLDSFLDTEPSNEAIAQALQGRRFTADVYKDEYNPEKPKMKLRNLRAPSGPAPQGVLGGPSAGGFTASGPAGPAASAPAPQTPQQPVQPQFQQPQQPVAQQYQQPIQQVQPQAPVQYQQPAPQVQQAQPQQQVAQQPENPWATGDAAPPLPPF